MFNVGIKKTMTHRFLMHNILSLFGCFYELPNSVKMCFKTLFSELFPGKSPEPPGCSLSIAPPCSKSCKRPWVRLEASLWIYHCVWIQIQGQPSATCKMATIPDTKYTFETIKAYNLHISNSDETLLDKATHPNLRGLAYPKYSLLFVFNQ